MTYDHLIIGAGFKGMLAAYLLAEKGHKVALLDKANSVGGFMSPLSWKGYQMDKGPQFLDNFSEEQVALMTRIVGEDALEDIGFSYAGAFNGTTTTGFAVPDFRALPMEETSRILYEVVSLAQKNEASEADNFADYLIDTYGPTAGAYMHAFTRKALLKDPIELAPSAAALTVYCSRLLVVDNDEALMLKTIPALDDRIVAAKVFTGAHYANLYPKEGTLETFRALFEKKLQDIGVEFKLGLTITDVTTNESGVNVSCEDGQTFSGRTITFATDLATTEKLVLGTSRIADKTFNLPQIFYFFEVPFENVTETFYMQQYTKDSLYSRATFMGLYTKQKDADGNTVICAEVPAEMNGDLWNDPDAATQKVWDELRETGFITEGTYTDYKAFKVPGTYKVPLKGFNDVAATVESELHKKLGAALILPRANVLTRTEIIHSFNEHEELKWAA